MTSNDFAANLYDIEVTFVTVAYGSIVMYTVNHKKRDILFLTITLANLNRFL